jgi:IclR family transcriptional regulator, KDG regulon repressor
MPDATEGILDGSGGYRAPAVLHAVRLLEAFAAGPAEYGISELSRQVGLSKSTVHRLVATLVEVGWLERNPTLDKYRLGLKLFELGSAVAARLEVRECALPLMHDLVQRVGETVHLAILDGDHVVYVAKVESQQAIRLFTQVGGNGPAHCTGVGKVLLAHAPAAVVEQVIAAGLPQFTPHTITEPAALRAHLAEAQRRGYALNLEESELGLVSVAAPVRDHSGAVVAGLSVAGPSQRLPAGKLPGLIARTVETAEEISRRMGYRNGTAGLPTALATGTGAEPVPLPAGRSRS